LIPQKGLKKLSKALCWPFEKGEIKDILGTIERQKSLFSLALQNDNMYVITLWLLIVALFHRPSSATSSKLVTCFRLWNLGRSVKNHCSLYYLGSSLLTTSLDQENRLQEQESRNIVAWLSPINFWITQNDIFSRRQAETGEWFLITPEFKAWIEGVNNVLCCPGIRTSSNFSSRDANLFLAGAGKTILAYVINVSSIYKGIGLLLSITSSGHL
jgi:hypothetical protein